MKCIKYPIILSLFVTFAQCRPEMPPTSVILIDMESATVPVDKTLYGLTLSADPNDVDGMYGGLIQNPYFNNGDSLPGWRPLSDDTHLRLSTLRSASEEDAPYSLVVSIYTSTYSNRGGVAAEGFQGIPIRQGESYHLSFMLRTISTMTPSPVRIALQDSLTSRPLSNVFDIMTTPQWARHELTLTATETAGNALLTFTVGQSAFFLLDHVLLASAPEGGRPNVFRPSLMERVAALSPAFILHSGDSSRTNIRAHRQMCAELNAEAMYAGDSIRMLERRLCADSPTSGSHREAIGEACFLIDVERHPRAKGRIVYAPATKYAAGGRPTNAMISFTNQSTIVSPVYHLLNMFARRRGDMLLQTTVDTYHHPLPEWTNRPCYAADALPDGMPSIAAVATWDAGEKMILLKVVNTTAHEEITEINFRGIIVASQAEVIEMKALPEARNTFDRPHEVEPEERVITLPTVNDAIRYPFPPHSITVFRLRDANL
jgi:hypothetical protein